MNYIKPSHEIRIGGHIKADPGDLVSLKADVNYTHITFANGEKVMVATTLKKLQARLEPYGFYRIHKNAVINLRFVKRVRSFKTGTFVFLENTEKVQVSKRREQGLHRLLSQG